MKPVSAFLSLLLIGCVLSTSAAAAAPPSTDDSRDRPAAGATSDFEKKRERWNRLPRHKKERLRRLQKALQNMDEPARKKLVKRLRQMNAKERQTWQKRSRELRRRTPAARRQLRERQRGLDRWFRGLPAPERERLLQLSPEQRRAAVRKHAHSQRRKAVEAYLRKNPGPEARREYQALPREEQDRRLRSFLRSERQRRRAQRSDRRPPGRADRPSDARQQRGDRKNRRVDERGSDRRLPRLAATIRRWPPAARRVLLGWKPGDPVPSELGENLPPKMISELEKLTAEQVRELQRRVRAGTPDRRGRGASDDSGGRRREDRSENRRRLPL